MPLDRHGPAGRLVDALRESSALFFDLLQTRIALFANEVQVELDRVRISAMLLLGAMTCFALALVLLVLFVVTVFWDTHRLAAIGGCGGVLLLAALALAYGARRRVSAAAAPFSATLHELRADMLALRQGDAE
jgi:uncharacterized membrane protein YqjE